MRIKKAYKYRIKPNRQQQEALAIQFGHTRFVYNYALGRKKEYYQANGKGLSFYDVKKEITQLKRESETEWLKQADSQVLQSKVKDLDIAYKNFFEGRAKYPRFKSKRSRQSIRYPQRFKVEGNKIYLPKVGWVKAIIHRPIEGEMKNCTVSKTKSGQYFVSIQCEVEIDEPVYEGQHIGVDLGLRDFLTINTGEKIDNPRHLRQTEEKLAKAQRQLSRKVKGSANWEKQRIKVAKIHERVANQRRDFHHKLSYRLVMKNRIITLENLNVKGMVRNRKLAKSIADAGWSGFVSMIEYKGAWYGCHAEKINRFFPSSKTCSECGAINHDLTISDSKWVCTECGVVHDRDINAAINIQAQSTVGAAETP